MVFRIGDDFIDSFAKLPYDGELNEDSVVRYFRTTAAGVESVEKFLNDPRT